VYNIETAMPSFDLEAIENHLKAAKEEEKRVCIININSNSSAKFYRGRRCVIF